MKFSKIEYGTQLMFSTPFPAFYSYDWFHMPLFSEEGTDTCQKWPSTDVYVRKNENGAPKLIKYKNQSNKNSWKKRLKVVFYQIWNQNHSRKNCTPYDQHCNGYWWSFVFLSYLFCVLIFRLEIDCPRYKHNFLKAVINKSKFR